MEKIRIEISSKDEFWGRAFHVEWEHQFPDRSLIADGSYFLVERGWLDDLDRVAAQIFCRIIRAPINPRRRQWLSSLLARRDKN